MNYSGNIIPSTQLSSVALQLLQYYPAPNRPGTTPGVNNLQSQSATRDENDQVLVRVDQNAGNKIRFSVRYNWYDTYNSNIGAIPVQGITQPRVNKNTLVSYTHTLASNLHNDFRIGYHRIDFDTLNHFNVNGIPTAGSDLGIPGFDGDVKIQQRRPAEHQHQQLQRARRGRHELVSVRHDVPDVERPGLHERCAQHPRGIRSAAAGDGATGGQRSTRPFRLHRRHERLLGWPTS